MLAAGRPMLAIPGPSVIPDRVLNAMHRAAPDIYGPELEALTRQVVADLRAVAGTRHDVAIYIGNGHAGWEAALANLVARGDRLLVAATGRFGHGWAEIARRLGAEVEVIDFGLRAAIDPDRVAGRLAADRGQAIRAVLAVHADTSTSVRNDLAALRAALDAAGHPALLLADCIASLAADPFGMDACGVDVAVAASQKGLMTPPGLAFVWFGPKAAAARRRADPGPYWDWVPRASPGEFWQYWNGTAPTHLLWGLAEALAMILREEGLSAVLARHARIARAVWAAFEAWGQAPGGPVLNIADPALRSHAVTAVSLAAPQGTALRTWLTDRAGVTLGIGLGMAAPGDPDGHRHFRIGHMGHVNAHMILGTLGAVEAGMRAVGIPFAPGGLAAAAEVVAGA